MIIPDKRKAATVIISRMNGAEDKGPEYSGTEEQMSILEDIAGDLLNAVTIKSHHGIALALKAAFECLDSDTDDQGPDLE